MGCSIIRRPHAGMIRKNYEMMKKINFLFIVLLVLSQIIVQDAAFGPAAATNQLNIEASVGNHAKLVLDTNIVTLSNRDPDETEQIPALETEIKVVVKARTGKTNPVILQVIADGDLSSGAGTIPAQNVIWQASGKGFIGGVLGKTISQTAGF